MAKLTQDQVKEINAIISEIEKAIKPDSEIGARDRSVLQGLLTANKIEKKPKFFNCRREHSNDIVNHFIRNKSLKKNKFHMNAQSAVYIL
jgi:hypothetical protein